MNNKCAICGTKEAEGIKCLSQEKIFKKYRSHVFWLCYNHSVEFFKLGQEVFIKKYRSIAEEQGWQNEGQNKKTAFYF